jgi:tRNA pseudouridine32 synthase/23S rRNA pseudouridine746 synthase/23S rRNA pseudouridine1911/1915/1917 synthase
MPPPAPRNRLLRGLEILYEDDQVLAVNKPAGLLTIATAAEKIRTAYHLVTDHVRRGAPRSPERVFIVHRLDRETTGIVLFARTPEAKRTLQDGWENTEKHYLAVVHGRVKPPAGTLSGYLMETRGYRVVAVEDRRRGKPARTAYRVLAEKRGGTLLDVTLLTGRKHQIRVHLADAGHPVLGDRRYGKTDGFRHLALHARSLEFTHPATGERMILEAPAPSWFAPWLGRGPGHRR